LPHFYPIFIYVSFLIDYCYLNCLQKKYDVSLLKVFKGRNFAMMNQPFSRTITLSVLPLAFLMTLTSVSLSGCKNAEQEKLKIDYEVLKQENERLKSELATLKTQVTASTSQATQNTSATEGATSYPAVSPQAFKDVSTDVPTHELINDLALLKVFDGIGTEFKPFQPITRGEYIIWLYKAYNAQRSPDKQIRLSPAFTMPFSDLAESHPAYKYVQAFANAGFSVGYENKTFGPDKPLTREEMIAIKHGVDGGEMYSNIPTEFSDDKLIDKRYHNDVYSEGIFKNDGPKGNNIMRAFGPVKTFKPKEKVLRYEAAATLWQTDHRGRVTTGIALGRTEKNS
jgi:hypothetical protein